MGPVRDFVKDAWRMAAACAAGAFVLSLLIGLIAANPFGIAFSRAFLFALLFGGLGAGLRAVLKSYFLQAAGAAPPAGGPGAAARPGSVDIVLPEDEALQRQAFQRPGTEGAFADGAGGSSEETSAASDDEPAEVLEAPEEEEGSTAEARALGELTAGLGDDLDPVEGAPRSRPSFSPASAGSGEEGVESEDDLSFAGGGSAGDLDALPDIAQLEPPQRSGPSARIPRAGSGASPEDAVRNLLSNEDPSTLARAIRTALKKDEKG